jgi:hypothetical protein
MEEASDMRKMGRGYGPPAARKKRRGAGCEEEGEGAAVACARRAWQRRRRPRGIGDRGVTRRRVVPAWGEDMGNFAQYEGVSLGIEGGWIRVL